MISLDPRTVAHVLGGKAYGRSCSVPGPGHSKEDSSLSIKIDPRAPDGFTLFSHAGDDPIVCRDYVRQALGLGHWRPGERRATPIAAAAPSGPDPEKEKKKEWALKIWSASTNPIGTIVERYLREHRGLELGDDVAGRVIRFHAGLKFDDAYLPGMVCLFRDIVTNEACGIHRTFLDRKTAEKIDRRMLGAAEGAAIMLDSHAAVSTKLTIGEGVETVLSARMMGLGPVWALGASGKIGRFPLLKSLTELAILEEDDLTSRRDVEACGRRYCYAGKQVKVITPSVGKDMNDAWRASL